MSTSLGRCSRPQPPSALSTTVVRLIAIAGIALALQLALVVIAIGVVGAVRAFASLLFGRVVLVAIGLGWICSGVYSVFRARLAER